MHEYIKYKKIDFQVSFLYFIVIFIFTSIGTFFFDMEHDNHTRKNDTEKTVEKIESTIKEDENDVVVEQDSSLKSDD